MMVKNELIQKFKSALKAEKMKFTPQRLSVLAEMVNNREHRECEEIYLSLRSAGDNVSRATVYRTLDILVTHNFARNNLVYYSTIDNITLAVMVLESKYFEDCADFLNVLFMD